MKTTPLLISLILAASLTACGKKEEAAAPATEAPASQGMEATQADSVSTMGPDGLAVDASAKYKASCASCHGVLGEGLGNNPKLAGLKRGEIRSKLTDYRSGKQLGPQTMIMAGNAKTLSDAEIEALALYLGE